MQQTANFYAPEPALFVLTAGTPIVTLGKAFYVYLIRDPRAGKNNVPVYVGKGRGRRARWHFWKGGRSNKRLQHMIAKCRAQGLEPPVELLARFTVEVDAFALEIELIAKYGRRDLGTGTLYNLTHGGDGASGSLTTSKHMRELMHRSDRNQDQGPGGICRLAR